MKSFVAFLFLVSCHFSMAQSNIIWSEDFEVDVDNYYDRTKHPSIRNNGDTLTVIGHKKSNNLAGLQVVHYNLQGDTIATRSYGFDSVANNELISYLFDVSGNVYLLHQDSIAFNKNKIVLQKYTANGNLIWVEEIQDIADTSYIPHSMALSSDTNLMITTYQAFDYAQQPGDIDNTTFRAKLYSYHSNGTQNWQRAFNPTTEVNWFMHDLFVHDEIAFIFANNYTTTHSLIKVDANNNLTANLSTGLQSGVNDIQLTPDNRLLVVSMTKYRISKCDLNGNVIWSEYYGTNLPSNVSGDEIIAVLQDSTGSIYATGRHYGDQYGTSFYSNADILTIKYDSSGTIVWENRFEYEGNNADIGSSLAIRFGKVYVGGRIQRNGVGSDYNYGVLEMDATDGVLSGGYMYNGPLDGDDVVSSICIIDNGDIAITGLSSINQHYDWTTQLIGNLTLELEQPTLSSEKELLRIVDLTGRETIDQSNQVLIYMYNDGSTEKVFQVE
ncbi:MAG: hypothetical protein NXI10_10445 [bacterium]|nr:hypothetical protein [bacterium]